MLQRGLLALLLLTLLSAAIPWFAGERAEAHDQQLLLDLEGRGFRVVDSRYERGWLVSEAEAGLLLGTAGWRLHASSRIEHGPLPWSDLRRGHFQPVAARATTRLSLSRGYGELQPLPFPLQSRVDLQGTTRVLLQSEEELFAQDADLSWLARGLQGELHLDERLHRMHGELRLSLLDLLEQDRPLLRLRNLAATAETARDVAGLRLGRGSLTLEEASVAHPDLDGPLRIHGLEVQVRSGAEGEMVWATAAYRAQKLEAGAERISSAELRIRVDKLSAPVLARLDRALRGLAATGPAGGLEALNQMVALAAILAKLLESDPELVVERLHLVTPDGAVEGRLTLTISGLRPLDLLNPRRWLEGLDGSGELSMPEALLHRLVAAQVRQHRRRTRRTGRTHRSTRTPAKRHRQRSLMSKGWIPPMYQAIHPSCRRQWKTSKMRG